MGPDLELKGKSEAAVEVSVSKENAVVPQVPEDKLLQCVANYEDNTFGMEALLVERTTERDGSENLELNITECTNSSDGGLVEGECQDATEHSSSFGGTESGTENGSMLADDEVESRLCGGNELVAYDGYYDLFHQRRKKKLTDHWQKFIRPLMWRCKWTELQIKELQSQALKYDRELAVYEQRKQSEFQNFSLEGFDVKSLPFSSQILRNKVMKRKKRKRVEDAIDITSYMSHHNLFSYYYENKRSAANGASMENDRGNLGIITNGSEESLDFGNADNSLEQLICKIEVVHSQVRKMKSRIDKVVSENPEKFYSVNWLRLLGPCDASTSYDQNPASPPDNGNRFPARSLFTASQHISEWNMGDLPMPDSAVSSHGEVTPLDSMDHPLVGGSCENTEDGILIHNQAAKEEMDDFGWLIENTQVPMEEQKPIPLVQVSESDLPSETFAPHVQCNGKSLPTSKSNNPRNTRRRGRRRASSSRWSRRSSG